MTTFVNNDVASGNVIFASDHNEMGSRIAAVVNGGLNDANINTSAAIATSKLADDAGVSTAKLADGAVTGSKIAISAIKLGYASSTTPQTGITSEVDATSLAATVTVPSGGRDILISGTVNYADTTSGAVLSLRIKEGSTLLRTWTVGTYNTTNVTSFCYEHRIAAPSAGSHTYKLTAQFSAGSGQLYGDAPTLYTNDMLVQAI